MSIVRTTANGQSPDIADRPPDLLATEVVKRDGRSASADPMRIVTAIHDHTEELAYAEDCLPRGVLGLTTDLFRDYVGYIADRRLECTGLPKQYGTRNPFPWMRETIDLRKEKNFFESRVTDYRSGSTLIWD